MDHLEICYRFRLKDGTVDTIDLKLNPTTLELIDNIPEDLPAWSELGFQQCPKCPLSLERTSTLSRGSESGESGAMFRAGIVARMGGDRGHDR